MTIIINNRIVAMVISTQCGWVDSVCSACCDASWKEFHNVMNVKKRINKVLPYKANTVNVVLYTRVQRAIVKTE